LTAIGSLTSNQGIEDSSRNRKHGLARGILSEIYHAREDEESSLRIDFPRFPGVSRLTELRYPDQTESFYDEYPYFMVYKLFILFVQHQGFSLFFHGFLDQS
jgi:hypothetical protein